MAKETAQPWFRTGTKPGLAHVRHGSYNFPLHRLIDSIDVIQTSISLGTASCTVSTSDSRAARLRLALRPHESDNRYLSQYSTT
jgi:hypothetical protein